MRSAEVVSSLNVFETDNCDKWRCSAPLNLIDFVVTGTGNCRILFSFGSILMRRKFYSMSRVPYQMIRHARIGFCKLFKASIMLKCRRGIMVGFVRAQVQLKLTLITREFFPHSDWGRITSGAAFVLRAIDEKLAVKINDKRLVTIMIEDFFSSPEDEQWSRPMRASTFREVDKLTRDGE